MRMQVRRSTKPWITILPGIVAVLALAALLHNLGKERPTRPAKTIFTSGPQLSRTSILVQKQDAHHDAKLKNAAEVPSFISSKAYTSPGCKCVRFGLSVESIKNALKMVEEYPSLFSSTFLQQHNFKGHSTCSDYSTQRGRGQNVVSYSFYSPEGKVDPESQHFKKYLGQIASRAYTIKMSYPDWIMRVYHNLTDDDTEGYGFLCKLFCSHQHVDLCHVRKLPEYGNLEKRNVVGRVWRFAVMGDPTVSRFLVRDSDSNSGWTYSLMWTANYIENWILDREISVVKTWLASDKGFHIIRDHPHHKAVMLAGLWGGTNKNATLMREVAEKMFSQPLNLTTKFDQELLATIVWPRIKNDVMQHDSYNCQRKGHENSLPFPVSRVDGQYCGWGPYKFKEWKKVLETKCPIECRPKTNKNWIYC